MMSNILLSAPVAFLIYVGLAAILSLIGRWLAGTVQATPEKTGLYASGEAPSMRPAAPGYRPFFTVALFFAILHLGVLTLGTGTPSPVAVVYLIGLLLALLALILG